MTMMTPLQKAVKDLIRAAFALARAVDIGAGDIDEEIGMVYDAAKKLAKQVKSKEPS